MHNISIFIQCLRSVDQTCSFCACKLRFNLLLHIHHYRVLLKPAPSKVAEKFMICFISVLSLLLTLFRFAGQLLFFGPPFWPILTIAPPTFFNQFSSSFCLFSSYYLCPRTFSRPFVANFARRSSISFVFVFLIVLV